MLSLKNKWMEVSNKLNQKDQIRFLVDSVSINRIKMFPLMGLVFLGISFFSLIMIAIAISPVLSSFIFGFLSLCELLLFVNYLKKLYEFKEKWYK